MLSLLAPLLANDAELVCDDTSGECSLPGASNEDEIEEPIIPKGANAEGRPLDVGLDQCKDRHGQCTDFAKQGECEENPGWMIVNCPESCSACHLLDPKVRCDRKRLNVTLEPSLEPGDMHRIFSEIESRYNDRYNVTVLSSDPWIVTFGEFLTDEEIDALIYEVDGSWERSTDTGVENAFGEVGRVISQSRTSSNAWCRKACEANPLVQNIMSKIEEVTQIPMVNYESFQVLKYDISQKYNTHHDSSEMQKRLACGPRIMTFFLYLSDVEEGGETAFPLMNIAVKPQKGKALLWANTLNHSPSDMDQRTMHEARPVVRGKKFAANSWIHMYNFETPNLHGCTGAFDQLS